jgi:subtilisin-like proprotein convertase family protein
MAAITYDFNIEQGSYYEITFVYQDPNGNPVDISDWCAVLQWTDSNNNRTVFSNRNKNLNYDLSTYSDGRITFSLPATTTNTYSFDFALYDLDLQEPNEQYQGSGYRTFRLSTGRAFIIRRSNPQELITNCIDLPSTESVCPTECLSTDIYAVKYSGGGINIPDNGSASSTIQITDTRTIENIELAINGLVHKNPQDLVFVLVPPTGSSILLSANQKIKNYRPGFNYIISDSAPADAYLHNITNNSKCRIYDKTQIINSDSPLVPSFVHLQNQLANGTWELLIEDTDPSESGSIVSWTLIVTYHSE